MFDQAIASAGSVLVLVGNMVCRLCAIGVLCVRHWCAYVWPGRTCCVGAGISVQCCEVAIVASSAGTCSGARQLGRAVCDDLGHACGVGVGHAHRQQTGNAI